MWWESLANESCVLKGRQAVTVLLDLFKCFERVLHVIAFKNVLKIPLSSVVAQMGVSVLSSSSSSPVARSGV